MNADFQSCSIDSLQTKPATSTLPSSTITTHAITTNNSQALLSTNTSISPVTSGATSIGELAASAGRTLPLAVAAENRGSDASRLKVMNTERPTKAISSSDNNNTNQQQPKRILHQTHHKNDINNHNATAKTSANQLNKPSPAQASSLAGINRISDCITREATTTSQIQIIAIKPPETPKSTTSTTDTLRQVPIPPLIENRNSKPTLCSTCHQSILSTGPSLDTSAPSPGDASSWLSSPQVETTEKLSSNDDGLSRGVATRSRNQRDSRQQQQQLHYCQRCLINAFEEELQLDDNSSHNFWKFISNLPKSIPHRRRSSSQSNLNSEVLGYLERFAGAIKMQQGELEELRSAQEERHSDQDQQLTVISRDSKSNIDQGKELRVINPVTMNKSASATLNSTITSNTKKALVENVQLEERCGADATGSGSKFIKITAPGELPSSTSSFNSTSGTKPIEQQQQQQQQPQARANKLSIATTLTTRSSVSSISSCILSSSSTSEVRLKWGKKMDFLLSIIGFAVDLANIWRFPYLVYKNGGGVFFIPYIIMLIFGGIPLFFLELCLGQFVKKGPITVWNKICPSMKGVGYCSILVSWYVSFYYNVLIAWSVYFIYRSIASFGDKMPWQDCDNDWNSKTSCVSIRELKSICAVKNDTIEHCRKELFSAVNVTSPASEFFVKELSQLDQSKGFDDIGYLRPELALCLLIVYLLHYMSLFRGLETSGKVVWVTATAPYIILSILLIRGLFLPGASMGVAYYLSPKLERLKDPEVWIDAAVQVFYSIGVGFGVHLTYASFNSHNNNCHRDCLMTSAVNAITSAYSGLVVFVYLGYMAKNLGIEIDKVANEGYGLIFEVYPEALTTLPFARFWSILFFIMLLTLGIDSAMGGLESVITGLEDEFKFAKRLTRGQLTGLVIISSFLPALISCTQGGAYTIFWLDIYSAGVSLLFSALFETIGVVYCYGLNKFIPNVESMLGRRPHMFYLLCWKYISPLFLCVVIVMSILTAQKPVYRNYTFPLWSIILGWILAFSSVCVVPGFALWYWLTNQKSKSRISGSPDRRKKSDRNSVGGSPKKTPTNYTPVSVNCPNHAQTRTRTTSHNNDGTNPNPATGGASSTSGPVLTTTTITTILNDHHHML